MRAWPSRATRLQLAGVEVAAGHRGPQPDPPIGPRLQLDLADREAQLVEAPDVGLDGEAVARLDLDLAEELPPEERVPPANRLRSIDLLVHRLGMSLERREVGQAEGDVLHEHVEVIGPLSVRQLRVDFARLGVDEVRGECVAVAPEERVGE